MRETASLPSHSRQSTPASVAQQLDAEVSRQNILNSANLSLKIPDFPKDFEPAIYESASRAPGSSESSRELPIFTTPPSRDSSRSTRNIGEYTHLFRMHRYARSHHSLIRLGPSSAVSSLRSLYSSCDRTLNDLRSFDV